MTLTLQAPPNPVSAGFVGERKPLDELDIPTQAHRLDVEEDHLRAFLEVEARSRGYDRKGRPIMLGEPHVFYRNLSGEKRDAAVKAGLAYRRWGEKPYPKDSYPWLMKAIEIDEEAALKACSIGLSQVLVENHSSVGFDSPQAMWQAFMDDEEEHVEAMVRFILVNGIDDDLRAERWETVARVYNGPGYKKHSYHIRMAKAFAKFRGIADVDVDFADDPDRLSIPDQEVVKGVQRRLKELGYPEVGRPDGAWGTKTRAAVLGFRADNGLPLLADIDDELLAALMLAEERPVSEARANTTVANIRAKGSRQIAAADRTEAMGYLTGAGSALKIATDTLSPETGEAPTVTTQVEELTEQVGAIQTLVDMAEPLVGQLTSFGPYILLGIAGYVVWQAWKSKQARVDDTRRSIHAG